MPTHKQEDHAWHRYAAAAASAFAKEFINTILRSGLKSISTVEEVLGNEVWSTPLILVILKASCLATILTLAYECVVLLWSYLSDLMISYIPKDSRQVY
jgi:hypothetical protein